MDVPGVLLKFLNVFLPYLNSRTLLVYYKGVARFNDCDYSYLRERKKKGRNIYVLK